MAGDLVTAAEMRAAEAAAIAAGTAGGLALMERAGAGVVAAMEAAWPGRGPVAVLCGPGNNGGDGFVIARRLAGAGREVAVLLYGTVAALPPDARANAGRWSAEGGEIVPIGAEGAAQEAVAGAGLIVDALFGTGLRRPLPEGLVDLARACARARARGAVVVAVDVPSGLCADSGRALGAAFAADLTVTFQAEKVGHRLAEGPSLCGRLEVVDIGLGPVRGGVTLAGCGPEGVAALAKRGGHKFDHGHALVLSGGAGRSGAARLAARGALRIGAGLVTLGAPPDAMAEVAAQVTAVMLRPLPDAAALAGMLKDGRITGLCLGPGLGLDRRAGGLVAQALADGQERGIVLDADALTLLAGDEGSAARISGRCVLTPHGGEFARLFPAIAARLAEPAVAGPAFSRVDAARVAAQRAGCVVLLKGPDTVIAAPDGRCAISSAAYGREVPWLATAGAGDVLAGFITGLLARGTEPFAAACLAAWLHVDCARLAGPGLIAEDLPEALPAVLRGLGL